MITFNASGRFRAQMVTMTCAVEDNRIVISSDADKILELAQAISAGLGAKEFTPANVQKTLQKRVFDSDCVPQISGWMKRVV